MKTIEHNWGIHKKLETEEKDHRWTKHLKRWEWIRSRTFVRRSVSGIYTFSIISEDGDKINIDKYNYQGQQGWGRADGEMGDAV